MKRKLLIAALGLVLTGGGGALAWWKLKPPPPPPPPPADQKKYDQISRQDYEKWMQSLGYTE